MLNEALRLIRVYHDLKQQELAQRLNISKSHLSEIESGKKTPSIELIHRYSEEFGIPASSILFFSENLNEPSRATNAKSAIANKIVQFLQIIENRTTSEKA